MQCVQVQALNVAQCNMGYTQETQHIRMRFTFGIKTLHCYYTPHEVTDQFVQLLVDRVDVVHTL